jgi:heme a synthase
MAYTAQRLLPKLALLTLALLYLVVLAGSVVRATGSGMGCPDWPKCYGRLIPPTAAEDIEFSKLDLEKYQKSWASHGRAAVEVTEASVRANFSAKETWIEFINRCLGALSGLAAAGTFLCALLSRTKSWPLISLLLGQLVLFGFTAWLGKVVVDTNLLPWKITLHMLLALGLITTAMLVRHWTSSGRVVPVSSSLRWHLWVCLALILVQFIFGTQVRETVDHLGAGECCDGRLEERLGLPLVWHRVGAILTLTALAIAFFRLKFRPAADAAAPALITLLGLLIAMEYGAGVLLVRTGLPALLQPVHLFLAFVLHGIVLALLLRSRLQKPGPAPKLADHE